MQTHPAFDPDLYKSHIPSRVLQRGNPLDIHAWSILGLDISDLEYPSLFIVPLTPEGELTREHLIFDLDIDRYGYFEHLFEFEGELYNALVSYGD